MQPHNVFEALQLAVSPVILISACGMLLLSMTNRLGRAIDRARTLGRESPTPNEAEIQILVGRAKCIRASILFLSLCIFLTAVLILALFVSVYLSFDITFFIGTLFVLSILCLGISLGYFIFDINSSLRAMEADLCGIRTKESNDWRPPDK